MIGKLWVIFLGVALLGFWLLGAHNRLVRLRGAIGGTFPALEIQLRKRQSLVRHLATSLLPPADAAAMVPNAPGSDDGAPPVAEMHGGKGFVADAPLQALAEAAIEASRQARESVERLHKRAVLRGLMQNVQDGETALEAALAALADGLADRAVEAPLPSAQSTLLERLRQLREPIAFSAEAYNRAVEQYNAALEVFPTTLAAGVFQFQPAAPLSLQPVGPPSSSTEREPA